MTLLGINTDKLNDLIFEKRNKNYGAYVIRQGYNNTIIKSLMSVSVSLVLIYASIFIYNKTHQYHEIQKPLLLDDPKVDPIIYETTIEIEPPKHLPSNTQQNSSATANVVSTNIVDNAIENNTITDIENSTTGTGTENLGVTTNSIVGSGTSTLTALTTTISEYVVVQDMPEFEGGTAALLGFVAKNIVYPSLAREVGQEGTVYVSFVVNETGNVEGVKIIKGIGYGCDEEVIRVINKLPKWKKAGFQDGKAVKVRFNIPVSFKLK